MYIPQTDNISPPFTTTTDCESTLEYQRSCMMTSHVTVIVQTMRSSSAAPSSSLPSTCTTLTLLTRSSCFLFVPFLSTVTKYHPNQPRPQPQLDTVKQIHLRRTKYTSLSRLSTSSSLSLLILPDIPIQASRMHARIHNASTTTFRGFPFMFREGKNPAHDGTDRMRRCQSRRRNRAIVSKSRLICPPAPVP